MKKIVGFLVLGLFVLGLSNIAFAQASSFLPPPPGYAGQLDFVGIIVQYVLYGIVQITSIPPEMLATPFGFIAFFLAPFFIYLGFITIIVSNTPGITGSSKWLIGFGLFIGGMAFGLPTALGSFFYIMGTMGIFFLFVVGALVWGFRWVKKLFGWGTQTKSLAKEAKSFVSEIESEKKDIAMLSDAINRIDQELDKLARENPPSGSPAYYAREKQIADLEEKRKILQNKLDYITSRRGK